MIASTTASEDRLSICLEQKVSVEWGPWWSNLGGATWCVTWRSTRSHSKPELTATFEQVGSRKEGKEASIIEQISHRFSHLLHGVAQGRRSLTAWLKRTLNDGTSAKSTWPTLRDCVGSSIILSERQRCLALDPTFLTEMPKAVTVCLTSAMV